MDSKKVFRLKAAKASREDQALTNCVFVSPSDFDIKDLCHLEVKTGPTHRYVFTARNDRDTRPGTISFSMFQRKWAQISLDQDLEVQQYVFNPRTPHYVGAMTLVIDFHVKKNANVNPLDSDRMAREFLMTFPRQVFTVGQELVFKFNWEAGQEKRSATFAVTVKEIEALDMNAPTATDGSSHSPTNIQIGELMPNSMIIFDKAEGSLVNMTGKSKGKHAYRSIVNPDWDFQKLGVGGLDNEFSAIFRRAFASRLYPPELIEQLCMKHVRGILLFGPPGTGKTLMARQIGKMLNAREPKIVNGPEILDKYVGESEANIRKLFADAEEESKRVGPNSGLHIIIFDEIDAICKQRGAVAGSSAVHDTVVNQLLSKIDGVDQLNNILLIGMTNRRDMIDEALLRPGRLELQMEISLPDEHGRVQILNIHTSKMKEYDKLGTDVDIKELAALTKNFSGAELEGLVRAAQSSAMNRLVKVGSKVELDPQAIEKLKVVRDDFLYALENDIKPAFGLASNAVDRMLDSGIIVWGDDVKRALEEGELLVNVARSPDTRRLFSVLIEGPPHSGKTALAAHIAKQSGFPFIKVVSPEDMVGFTETAKCAALHKAFEDSYKSPLSVLLIDDLERIIDFCSIGPRFSNIVLQALLILLRKKPPAGKKLLVLVTTSEREVMEELKVVSAFSSVLHVSPITTGEQIIRVLEDGVAFSADDIKKLRTMLQNKRCCIGIKKLLDLIDLASQSGEEYRAVKFITKLEEEGRLT